MTTKQDLLTNLQTIFDRWETLLASKSPAEITARPAPDGWSLQDEIAHLAAWQGISNARLEAAQLGSEPEFPAWLGGADPFYVDDHADDYNLRIYSLNRDRDWPGVFRDWRAGFERLLKLAGRLPESDLYDKLRYPWLEGYCLSDVLEGTLEHHQEHLQPYLDPPG
jgi:hypothetical protein